MAGRGNARATSTERGLRQRADPDARARTRRSGGRRRGSSAARARAVSSGRTRLGRRRRRTSRPAAIRYRPISSTRGLAAGTVGHAPGSASATTSSVLTRGTRAGAQGVAAEHGVEGEGPPGLGEEPLGAGLPGNPAAQGHGGEVRLGAKAAGRPCRANSAVPTLSGPYSNRVANTSDGPHQGDGAAAEVADVVGDGEGGELRRPGRSRPPWPGRTKIRPSKPSGSRAVMPWAPMVATTRRRRTGPRPRDGKTSSSVRG